MIMMLTVVGLMAAANGHLTSQPKEESVFLPAWTAAVRAMASGRAPPSDDPFAYDLLRTLASESQNPTIRLMAQTALGKVEPEVKRWVETLVQEERNKKKGRRYEKEKQAVKKAHSTWSRLNWQLTEEALREDNLNLLLQALHTSTLKQDSRSLSGRHR